MREADNKIKIKIHNFEKIQIMKELIDEFLPPDRYEVVEDDGINTDEALHINLSGSCDKDEIKREIYTYLSTITRIRPDWGILTGVRPIKLAGEIYDTFLSREDLISFLKSNYFLTDEKARLAVEIYEYQIKRCGKAALDSLGVYVGIPFCPTRCLYCSFTSNQVGNDQIEEYLEALHKEIIYCGREMKRLGLHPESIYFGGGTPTTVTADQMDKLLDVLTANFPLENLKEFCIEAGRPDTITLDKLNVIKSYGVSRISINPQSMKERTLELIGRSHSPEDIVKAFEIANQVGFEVINADLIAGLPEEDVSDFVNTLNEVIELGVNNITIHTLAVKRASRLKDVDNNYHYRVAETVGRMLEESRKILYEKEFIPYYLYRQKHMAGGYENTGYCKYGKENLYNIRIMDEHQSILALGAGGISKLYFDESNKLERVPNVSNYREYINRIDEMIDRKRKGFFIDK